MHPDVQVGLLPVLISIFAAALVLGYSLLPVIAVTVVVVLSAATFGRA